MRCLIRRRYRYLIRRRLFNLLLGLTAIVMATGVHAKVLDPVRLQLKWLHQFQFAGYYAAVEKGFYREAGLDVTLVPALPGQETIPEVLKGRAEFGVGTSDLLLSWNQGAPIVVLAVILQHSPLALATSAAQGINTPQDLLNKRVQIEPHSAELLAYLQREGISLNKLKILRHNVSVDDLISGKVAAMSVYTTTEPYWFKQANLDYRLFEPRSSGIDFYGDNLFTTREQVEEHPQRVRAFREASLRGWAYALEHPDEIARLIYERYSQRMSQSHLMFEAEKMHQLMQPELIEIGYQHIGRWRHMADTYAEVGMLPAGMPLNGLLYEQNERQDVQSLTFSLVASLLAVALIAGFGIYLMRLNRRIKASQSRYEVAYRHSPLAFVIWNEKYRIVDWNQQAEQLFGWTRDEAMGQDPIELLVAKEDQDKVRTEVATVEQGGDAVRLINHNMTRGGDVILCEWVNSQVLDERSGRHLMLGLAVDVTEREAMRRNLEFLAHHDTLTGLPNRARLFERLEYGLSLARRSRQKLAFLFIDLDGFKSVNDQYGHAAGDQLLKEVAESIRGLLRESDTVARISGDEFGVILYPLERRESALTVAEKILERIHQPTLIAGQDCQVGASIGIATFPTDADSPEALVRLADDAMYDVKRGGKNAVRFVADH